MTASEIRQSFLDFFKQRDHKIVPSAPVVPQDDPTLLFTNAGMNQFKDVFLNTGTRPYRRAADSQKCIRVSGKHNDLEEVGYDTYHHTFFEMLGNWSFGNYYKEEAIRWAWELITGEWGLPKAQLWATVFREDDEAEVLWKKVTDIAPSHVLRFDEKDNFWEMGEIGPCGPCSELHIDLGEGYCDKQHIPGHVCTVNGGCARIIELWNLVFIQFNRDEKGALTTLPAKHVDTGMGLERAVAVMQGKKSNYQSDLFMPVMTRIADLTGQALDDGSLLPAFRVISDHIRALSFAITDGAIPSNEGRGYVLRRILRRAARYGRQLGMHEPFIYKLVPTLAEVMGDAYPELIDRARHVTLVLKAEEERFNDVLDRGIEIFEDVVSKTLKRGGQILSGDDVFRLYDTFGFPLDLTQLMARERGFDVDQAEFKKLLDQQRDRARQAGKFTTVPEGEWQEMTSGPDSKFIGYETIASDAEIRKLLRDGNQLTLILNRTPFYGEAGGQVGDTGEITGDGFRIRIHDTQRQGDQILHIGTLVEGDEILNPQVNVCVTEEVRLATARNHTVTHLLHKALREVLGDHVNQGGSLVTPDRLRFDFTHFEAMTSEQIDDVERRVNRNIRKDYPVEKFVTTLDDAKARGATALFGEKYAENVRVVKIDTYSMELCGGTHIDRTGQIGLFRITSEEAIAAGVRRIEAVSGEAAEKQARGDRQILHAISTQLRCRTDEVETRIASLLEERKDLERRMRKAQKSSSASVIDDILQRESEIGGVRIIASRVDEMSIDAFRQLGDQLRERLKSGVGLLGMVHDKKVHLLCVVTDDLIKSKQLKAGDIVRQVARLVGGSGGGKPHMALAGGKEPGKLNDALGQAPVIIGKLIQSA